MSDLERVFTSKIQDLDSSPIERVIESINVNQAITEYIDNSRDSGATEITITRLKDKNNKEYLQIWDNGCGMCEVVVKEFLTHYKYHKPIHDLTTGLKGSGSKSASYRLVDFGHMKDNTQEKMYVLTCDGSPTVIHGELLLCKGRQLEESVFIKASDTNKEIGKSYTVFTIPLNIAICFDRLEHYISLSYPNCAVSIKLIDTIDGFEKEIEFVDRCLTAGIIDNTKLWGDNAEQIKSLYGLPIESENGMHFLHSINIPTANGLKPLRIIGLCLSNKGSILTKENSGSGVTHEHGGIFVLRGGRYINFGHNFAHVMGISGNVGGVGRYRILLIADDDDVANALGIKTNKGEMINSISNDFDVLNPNRTVKFKSKEETDKMLPEELGFFDKLGIVYKNILGYYEDKIKNTSKPHKEPKRIKLSEVEEIFKNKSYLKKVNKEISKVTTEELQFKLVVHQLRMVGVGISAEQELNAKKLIFG